MIPELYNCYRPGYGFAVVGPDLEMNYTQHPHEASEADSSGWLEVYAANSLSDCVLLPAWNYVYKLKMLVANNALLLDPEYLDPALLHIKQLAEQAEHYPGQSLREIKKLCKAILARQPYDTQPVPSPNERNL